MPDDIDVVIEPKERDLGDFTVRRVLPSSATNVL